MPAETAPTSLLGTGLKGLVGSKLTQVYQDQYHFDSLDISDPDHPVDITQLDQVRAAFEASDANHVIHAAAFTNVTAAWEQRDDTDGLAYQVNVTGTDNIIQACQEFNKHLIHLSTAYVFDGEKSGLYTEDDQPNPIEWYGQTKYLAEEHIQATNDLKWTILRIDQPFRSDRSHRPDIAHRIMDGLQDGSLYPQFTDHFFGPTFIDDFVKVIEWVVRTNTTGLFHASSGEQWSDYQFATALRDALGLEKQIAESTLDEYLATLNRPYQRNTALDTSKLEAELDFELTPIETALTQVEA